MASVMQRMHSDMRQRHDKFFCTIFTVVDFAVWFGWYGCR
jgi:hypothetical protein